MNVLSPTGALQPHVVTKSVTKTNTGKLSYQKLPKLCVCVFLFAHGKKQQKNKHFSLHVFTEKRIKELFFPPVLKS